MWWALAPHMTPGPPDPWELPPKAGIKRDHVELALIPPVGPGVMAKTVDLGSFFLAATSFSVIVSSASSHVMRSHFGSSCSPFFGLVLFTGYKILLGSCQS